MTPRSCGEAVPFSTELGPGQGRGRPQLLSLASPPPTLDPAPGLWGRLTSLILDSLLSQWALVPHSWGLWLF